MEEDKGCFVERRGLLMCTSLGRHGGSHVASGDGWVDEESSSVAPFRTFISKLILSRLRIDCLSLSSTGFT